MSLGFYPWSCRILKKYTLHLNPKIDQEIYFGKVQYVVYDHERKKYIYIKPLNTPHTVFLLR